MDQVMKSNNIRVEDLSHILSSSIFCQLHFRRAAGTRSASNEDIDFTDRLDYLAHALKVGL